MHVTIKIHFAIVCVNCLIQELKINLIHEVMDSNRRNTRSITYKLSHVEFTCTDDQKERLESELKATSLVVDVKITDTKSDDHAIAIEQNPLCLLYTSPSPRDATLSRMPSSA